MTLRQSQARQKLKRRPTVLRTRLGGSVKPLVPSELATTQEFERVKLSIVIPCYNEERTLEACVDAVLAIQDATLEVELIVVDDCSKDDSLNVARRLQQRVPGMILLHHKINQARALRCAPGLLRQPGNSWPFRMPIASTTPGTWCGC